MHFSTLILTAIAAVGITAAPASDSLTERSFGGDGNRYILSDPKAPYVWKVKDFGYGCSPGGCSGGGKVTAAATKDVPAFHLSCGNTNYQTPLVPCTTKDGKNSTEASFFWSFAEHSSDYALKIHMEYDLGHGKKLVAKKIIPNPGYEQTEDFTLKPKLVHA